ncbi:hypothetical protein [Thalassolituus sp.]|uniref:hypothetical protein n=1 Tax=Thalassolituus sp. TaxID=2030822 RepID=UPI0035120E01
MSATKTGYAQIFSSDEAGLTHNVYIPASQKASWVSIKNSHVGNYYETTLLRAVLRLAVGDRTVAPQATIGEFSFSYTTSPDRKDIFINLISIESNTISSSKTPGVYKSKWTGDKWLTPKDASPAQSMELKHHWGDSSHVAAIPGKFDNKEDAASKMGEHIEKAYLNTHGALTGARQKGNYFSMFWTNNEFTSKQHVQTIVSLIQQAQKQNKEIKWLIHGEGCGTFVKALQFIQKNPIDHDLYRAHQGLEKQNLFFSNPRGSHTSKASLEKLAKSIGIKYVEVRLNKDDIFLNPDARWELIKPLIGAAGGVAFTGFGSHFSSEFGLENAEKLMTLASSNIGDLSSAAAVAGGVILVVGSAAKLCGMARNLKGAVTSTFGSGNLNWAA